MCVCPCCPCSGLVSSTLLILSPRWQTAPSTLLLQISASSHPVQPNPKVGHVLWPFWVIFFQKSKRGYLSPEGVSSLCVCVRVCSLNSRKHKPVCVCQVWMLAHKRTGNKTHNTAFSFCSFHQDFRTMPPISKLSPNRVGESVCADSVDEASFFDDLFTL